MKTSKWDLEGIFVVVMGLTMAVLFTLAPFVRTQARTGDSVIDQARAYEQACQTVSDDESQALQGARRC